MPTRLLSLDILDVRALCAAGLIAVFGLSLPAAAKAVNPTGITGTVTNASSSAHEPIANLNVCVSEANNNSSSSTCSKTQLEGKYTIELSKAGTYTVRLTGQVCVSGSDGSLDCAHEYVEQTVEHVQVTAGSLTTVNAALLEVDGKISGKVTSSGAPVERIEVCALGNGFACETTNSKGEYTIERLAPGAYTVRFSPLISQQGCTGLACQPADYIPQYWSGALALESASAVIVKESQLTQGINAEMQVGGHISGKVASASIYAEAIAGVRVCAYPTATNKEGQREGAGEGECAYTNSNGEYTIGTLATGGYEVEFTGVVCAESGGKTKCTQPYIGLRYQSIVSVTAPDTTAGVNGGLLEVSPTKPTNTAAPALTGVPAVGKKLSCSQGGWANRPTGLSYRWLRDGVAISGQTASAYIVQKADAGDSLACEVTASNAAGPTGAVSNAVQIPRPTPGVAVVIKVSVANGTVVSATLGCTGFGACSGALRIVAQVTTGHGRHARTHDVTIGLASFSMGLGKRVTLRVRLNGQGAKLLRRAGHRGLRAQMAGSGLQAHRTVLHGSIRR